MRSVFFLFIIVSCASPIPHRHSDLQFCKEDVDCVVYRSPCGKRVAFNVKYAAYVEGEFAKREAKMSCSSQPDPRRFIGRCEMNSCVLLER